MPDGHCHNFFFVLAAVHGILGLPGWRLFGGFTFLSPFSHSSRSLIGLHASVDVKQQQQKSLFRARGQREQEGGSVLSFFIPSLISRMVSVDVKHHERGRISAGWGARTDWPRQKCGRQRRKSGHTGAESLGAGSGHAGSRCWDRTADRTACCPLSPAIIIRLGSGTSRAHLSVDPTVHRPAKPPPPKQRLGVRGEKSDPYRCQPTARVAKRRPGPH